MSKTHVIFKLSSSTFSVDIWENSTSIESEVIHFETKDIESQKELIAPILTKIKSKEYDEYSLSWFSPKSVLIPNSIFEVSLAKSIFETTFFELSHQAEIDFNRIPSLSQVNIFEIPSWVKSFFVMRFPRIVIQHESTHYLRGIFSSSGFKLSAHLVNHDFHCSLFFVKHNELKFYNCFEINSTEDIVFYFLTCIKKLKLETEICELYVHDVQKKTQNELKEIFSKIQELKHVEFKDSTLLSLKYQSLCV
jgi:hypothetical protein